MFYKALLLLLPKVAYAQINIFVEVENERSHRIFSNGSVDEIIPDAERETWQLSDVELKHVILECEDKLPNVSYADNPTLWDDLYEPYKKRVYRRVLTPDFERVFSISYEYAILATQHFISNNTVMASYSPRFKVSFEETMSTEWYNTGNLTVAENVRYNVMFGESNDTNHLSLTAPWGNNTKTSKIATIETEFAVDSEPGELIAAGIYAFKGTMEIRVDYEAHLDGIGRCRWLAEGENENNCTHHVDIGFCLHGRLFVDSYVFVKIEFFVEPQLVIYRNNVIASTHKLSVNRNGTKQYTTLLEPTAPQPKPKVHCVQG